MMIGGMQYKWKPAEAEISGWSPSKKWRCTLLSGDFRDGVSVPGKQGQGRTPIATFTPPQQRLRNAELQIFANLSQQPRSSVSLPHGYPVSRSASTQPSHLAHLHSPSPYILSPTQEPRPQNYAEYTTVAQLGGQSRPRATTGPSVSRGSARERSPVRAIGYGYTASFPGRPAQSIRSATSALPTANEPSSRNLVGPRRNRGPSDGVLTGAISPSASERRQPPPISTPPAALESPPLAVIDGLITCCILLAAGKLEYRGAQSEPPASPSSPSAPIDQRAQDGRQLTTNRQGALETVPQFGLPRPIVEVQRQLYERYMVAGSTSTLPIYEATEESSAAEGFRLSESQPPSLPPSYSAMGGE